MKQFNFIYTWFVIYPLFLILLLFSKGPKELWIEIKANHRIGYNLD